MNTHPSIIEDTRIKPAFPITTYLNAIMVTPRLSIPKVLQPRRNPKGNQHSSYPFNDLCETRPSNYDAGILEHGRRVDQYRISRLFETSHQAIIPSARMLNNSTINLYLTYELRLRSCASFWIYLEIQKALETPCTKFRGILLHRRAKAKQAVERLRQWRYRNKDSNTRT